MLRPIKIDEETVPFRIMGSVGPGGSFLQEDHTVNNFKNTFWFPCFFNRKVFDEWEKEGGKDIHKILNEKSKEIFDIGYKYALKNEALIRTINDSAQTG